MVRLLRWCARLYKSKPALFIVFTGVTFYLLFRLRHRVRMLYYQFTDVRANKENEGSGSCQMRLVREVFTEKTTIGSLYINGDFFCYTLEDKTRPIKIYGETAIPKGMYTRSEERR